MKKKLPTPADIERLAEDRRPHPHFPGRSDRAMKSPREPRERGGRNSERGTVLTRVVSLLLLLALPNMAQAWMVATGAVRTAFGTVPANTPIIITPSSTPVAIDQELIMTTTVKTNTAADGTLSMSLLPGSYTLRIGSTTSRDIVSISVTATNGSYSWAYLATNGVSWLTNRPPTISEVPLLTVDYFEVRSNVTFGANLSVAGVISGDGSGLTNLPSSGGSGVKVAAGSGVTAATNTVGADTVVTLSASGGSGVKVAAGSGVTATTNTVGADTVVTLSASGSSGSSDLTPLAGYISGLGVSWDATNQITVGTGTAWIEASNALCRVSSALTTNVGTLTASAWHYVYLAWTNGVTSLVVSTNPPAPAFAGSARSRTNAPTQRLLFAALSDAGGGLIPFQHVPASASVIWLADSTAHVVLNAGTNTTSTTVSAAAVVPPQSLDATIFLRNYDTNVGVFLGRGDFTVSSTVGQRFLTLPPDKETSATVPLDAQQRFAYRLSTGQPLSGTNGLRAVVTGFTWPR